MEEEEEEEEITSRSSACSQNQSDKICSEIHMGDRYGSSIWKLDMEDRTSMGYR